MDAGLRHREGPVGEKSNDSNLTWHVSKLQNQVNLCVLVVTEVITVLVDPPILRRHLAAIVDPDDVRLLVYERCNLEDVVVALCKLKYLIVHRTRFTP